MAFPIRLLIVERDPAIAKRLEQAAGALASAARAEVAVTCAASPAEAAERLGEGEFDLIVDDLSEGVELFRAIAREHPGVPVIVLADAGDPGVVNELLAAARKEDLFGTEEEVPMISCHPRERVEDCVAAIEAMLRSIAETAALAVEPEPPLELTTSEARAIQIFARRTEAERAAVTGLSGGLSGAKTVVVDAADESGMRTAHVVGKLTGIENIRSAVDGYENAIPDLPAGLGAALAGVVTAGAGDSGAVFYRLADDYSRSFFECIATEPADAAEACRRLHARFADRYPDLPTERETVEAIRRDVIEMAPEEAVAPLPDLDRLDPVEIETRRGIQHRDLHGLNVLVSDSNEPLLIDYDNYAAANCAVDPVTLEMSAIFHRDETAQKARAGWPSIEQARSWSDLDAYLEGCPYPEAIRACRAWGEDAAATPQELAATMVAVALRQFWFDNTDKELAAALIEGAEARLGDA